MRKRSFFEMTGIDFKHQLGLGVDVWFPEIQLFKFRFSLNVIPIFDFQLLRKILLLVPNGQFQIFPTPSPPSHTHPHNTYS